MELKFRRARRVGEKEPAWDQTDLDRPPAASALKAWPLLTLHVLHSGGSFLETGPPGPAGLGYTLTIQPSATSLAWSRKRGFSEPTHDLRAYTLPAVTSLLLAIEDSNGTCFKGLLGGLNSTLTKCQLQVLGLHSPPSPSQYTSMCPFSAASCRGVPPQESLMMGAPMSRSRSRIGVWPPRAAKCRAVAPSLSRAVRPMSVNVTW